MDTKRVKPPDGPIDEGSGGKGDNRINDAFSSKIGDRNGDPQRGGRPAVNAPQPKERPRPADDTAHDDIPSRTFDL